jgi:hypothetical protein
VGCNGNKRIIRITIIIIIIITKHSAWGITVHVPQTVTTEQLQHYIQYKRVVCILLGISPASDCDLPTFRNLLSVPSSKPLKMELTVGSETSANHNLTPGKYPKRIHTIFKTWRKFKVKKVLVIFVQL